MNITAPNNAKGTGAKDDDRIAQALELRRQRRNTMITENNGCRGNRRIP